MYTYMYVIIYVHNCMFWDSDKKYQEAGGKNTIHKFRIVTKQIWVPLLHFIFVSCLSFSDLEGYLAASHAIVQIAKWKRKVSPQLEGQERPRWAEWLK